MIKKVRTLFFAALLSFLLTAVVILLMPLDIMLGVLDAQWYDALLGALLYLSLIMGTVFSVLYLIKAKKAAAALDTKRTLKKGLPGIISFFKNPYGAIADIAFVAGLIGFIITIIIDYGTHYITYIFLAFAVSGFAGHCFFNGKYYNLLSGKAKHMQTHSRNADK